MYPRGLFDRKQFHLYFVEIWPSASTSTLVIYALYTSLTIACIYSLVLEIISKSTAGGTKKEQEKETTAHFWYFPYII